MSLEYVSFVLEYALESLYIILLAVYVSHSGNFLLCVPQGFCMAYRDIDGQAMDLQTQMDVDEFFNVLFDKLERSLPNRRRFDSRSRFLLFTILTLLLLSLLVRVCAGNCCCSALVVRQPSQLICKDCPHRPRTHEPFYTIALDVRGKKSIEEALELFIRAICGWR